MHQGAWGYTESLLGPALIPSKTFAHRVRAPFDIYRFAICCLCIRSSEMNIMTNYSLEFGVVMRAVCPTVSGLVG